MQELQVQVGEEGKRRQLQDITTLLPWCQCEGWRNIPAIQAITDVFFDIWPLIQLLHFCSNFPVEIDECFLQFQVG